MPPKLLNEGNDEFLQAFLAALKEPILDPGRPVRSLGGRVEVRNGRVVVSLLGYSEDQPRDERGRWASEGGLTESMSAWGAALTPDEQRALDSYQMFPSINGDLRQLGRPGYGREEEMALLDSAIYKSSLPEDVTVYRYAPGGVEPYVGEMRSAQVGDAWTDPAYVSTTTDRGFAGVMEGIRTIEAQGQGAGDYIKMVIPEGSHAAVLNANPGQSWGSHMEEVLLPRDSVFTLTGQEADGTWVAKVETPGAPGAALAAAANARSLLGYSEDEPRDEQGRWTDDGAGSSNGIVYNPPLDAGETPELTGSTGLVYVSDNPGTMMVDGREQALWKMSYDPETSEYQFWIPDETGFPHHDAVNAVVDKYEERSPLLMAGYGPRWTPDEQQAGDIREYAVNQAGWRTPEELGYIAADNVTRDEIAADIQNDIERDMKNVVAGYASELSDAVKVAEGNKALRAAALLAYSEDQPRDEHGRWTSSGGGGDVDFSGLTTNQVEAKLNERYPKTEFDLSGMTEDSAQRMAASWVRVADKYPDVAAEIPRVMVLTAREGMPEGALGMTYSPEAHSADEANSIALASYAWTRDDYFQQLEPYVQGEVEKRAYSDIGTFWPASYTSNPDGIQGAILTHEFGHAFGNVYPGAENTFNQVFDEDIRLGGYADFNGRERFAEAFEMMVQGTPSELTSDQNDAVKALRGVFKAEGLRAAALLAYSEEQPRDDHGRWTEDGASSGSGVREATLADPITLYHITPIQNSEAIDKEGLRPTSEVGHNYAQPAYGYDADGVFLSTAPQSVSILEHGQQYGIPYSIYRVQLDAGTRVVQDSLMPETSVIVPGAIPPSQLEAIPQEELERAATEGVSVGTELQTTDQLFLPPEHQVTAAALLAYSEDEPRDERGRWTEGEGGGTGENVAHRSDGRPMVVAWPTDQMDDHPELPGHWVPAEEVPDYLYHVGPREFEGEPPTIDSIRTYGLLPKGGDVGEPHPGQDWDSDIDGVFGHETLGGALQDAENATENYDGAGRYGIYRFVVPEEDKWQVRADSESSLAMTAPVPPTRIDVWEGDDYGNGHFEPLLPGGTLAGPADPPANLNDSGTPPVGHLNRWNETASAALLGYSEDQPRDEHGRWTSGGDSGPIDGKTLTQVEKQFNDHFKGQPWQGQPTLSADGMSVEAANAVANSFIRNAEAYPTTAMHVERIYARQPDLDDDNSWVASTERVSSGYPSGLDPNVGEPGNYDIALNQNFFRDPDLILMGVDEKWWPESYRADPFGAIMTHEFGHVMDFNSPDIGIDSIGEPRSTLGGYAAMGGYQEAFAETYQMMMEGEPGQLTEPQQRAVDNLRSALSKPGVTAALLGYSEDQPRDDHGRWSPGGGESSTPPTAAQIADTTRAVRDAWLSGTTTRDAEEIRAGLTPEQQAVAKQLDADMAKWQLSSYEEKLAARDSGADWYQRLATVQNNWEYEQDQGLPLARGMDTDPGWKQGDTVTAPLSYYAPDYGTAMDYGPNMFTIATGDERGFPMHAFPTHAFWSDATPVDAWVAGGTYRVTSAIPGTDGTRYYLEEVRPESLLAAALLAYSEDQPRDDHGRWTSGGDSGPALADEHALLGPSAERARAALAGHLTITEEDADVVQQNLADLGRVPTPLLEKLAENDLQVYIGDSPVYQMDSMQDLIWQIPNPDDVAGAYQNSNLVLSQVWTAENEAETGMKTDTAVHELGHAVEDKFMTDVDTGILYDFHDRFSSRIGGLTPYERGRGAGDIWAAKEMWGETFSTRFMFGQDAVAERYSPEYATWVEGVLTRMGTWGEAQGALFSSALLGYSDDQPRDEHGRWTSGGGGSSTREEGNARVAHTKEVLGDNLHITPGQENNAVVNQQLADLALMPDSLLTQFPEMGVQVYVGDQPIYSLDHNQDVAPGHEDALGVYNMQTHEMSLAHVAEDTWGGNPAGAVALHESGHVFESAYMSSEDFNTVVSYHEDLYQSLSPYEQGWIPGDPYAAREFWAESFATYIQSGFDGVSERYYSRVNPDAGVRWATFVEDHVRAWEEK